MVVSRWLCFCCCYAVFSLEKTFKTTFSLLVLHMWLCLRRLKEEGKEGVELGQYLYEIYNHDLELRVSKAGVSDLCLRSFNIWNSTCNFLFFFFYNMLKFVFGCEGFLDGCECGIFCLWKLLLMGEIAASLDFWDIEWSFSLLCFYFWMLWKNI